MTSEVICLELSMGYHNCGNKKHLLPQLWYPIDNSKSVITQFTIQKTRFVSTSAKGY